MPGFFRTPWGWTVQSLVRRHVPCPCNGQWGETAAGKHDVGRGHSFARLVTGPDRSANLLPGTSGRPLPALVRRNMETAFQQDFSSVRVHEDCKSRSIGAEAFTRGEHLHFDPGRFQPRSRRGRELLGHELTHVVQQRSGLVSFAAGTGLTHQ